MSRKKEALTLSVPPGTKEQLETIARRLGIFWGKSPSPSGLVVAIAQQQLHVGQEAFSLDAKQVDALLQARKALIDAGHVEKAEIVNALLINQGNLDPPLRQALLQQLHQPIQDWRNQIDQLKSDRQPFRLRYRNAKGQELEYTVRYAEVRFYEKRFYLQIWCEETAEAELDSPDMPEIWHNRCLRFDRILHIEPIPGVWKGELDSLKVYLHFYRGLANAYEPRPDEDLENTVLGDIRQVVRRVVNPFWLIRELLRYGKDCVIVAPDSVRERYKRELREICTSYGIELP
ncbi:helix-turn-helix transcriptional regulator [Aerosakkonemataceae cyanobacterium BLCC-F154]|uniref:Helix-turn-helix transcriptional regulator n=1 Tax=Floridaenema fluviatile BLCC-F154 TaxID=3153640 RepID=A0ABV4YKR0_9CYAN